MKRLFLVITIAILVASCSAPQLIIERDILYGKGETKQLIFKNEKRAQRFVKKYGGKLDNGSVIYKGDIPDKYKKRIK